MAVYRQLLKFDGIIPTVVKTLHLISNVISSDMFDCCSLYSLWFFYYKKTLFLEKDGDITTFVIPYCLRLIHVIWWVILSKVRILYTALEFILQYQYILSFVVRKCRQCNDVCGSQLLLVLDFKSNILLTRNLE